MDKAQALPVQFRSFTLTGCPLEEQAHQVGFRCFRASKPPKASRGWYIELKLVEVNHCVGQTFPDVFESTSDRLSMFLNPITCHVTPGWCECALRDFDLSTSSAAQWRRGCLSLPARRFIMS